jgi:hypothetical protein
MAYFCGDPRWRLKYVYSIAWGAKPYSHDVCSYGIHV